VENTIVDNNDFILQLIKIKKQLNLLGDSHVTYLKSYLINDNSFTFPAMLSTKKNNNVNEKAYQFKQLYLCFALMSLLKSKFTINKLEKQLNKRGISKTLSI
jgi:hypothetical protein